MLEVHLATFNIDATPPMGHPLRGGGIKPVVAVDDPHLAPRGRADGDQSPDRARRARLDGSVGIG